MSESTGRVKKFARRYWAPLIAVTAVGSYFLYKHLTSEIGSCLEGESQTSASNERQRTTIPLKSASSESVASSKSRGFEENLCKVKAYMEGSSGMGLREAFDAAADASKCLKGSDNVTRLKLYGFFKVAVSGEADASKEPMAWDIVAHAKWQAWMDATRMLQRQLESSSEIGIDMETVAKRAYVQCVAENSGKQKDTRTEQVDAAQLQTAVSGQTVDPLSAGMTVNSTLAQSKEEHCDENDIFNAFDLSIEDSTERLKQCEDVRLYIGQHKVDLNAMNESETTFLSLIAENNRCDLLKVLLEMGADLDPNIRDGYGYTALHSAACEGHLEMCRLLVSAGANVRFLSTDGESVLELAHDSVKQYIEEMLET